MHLEPAYMLGLGASFFYAVSAIILKKAIEEGAGVMRMTFFFNWMMVLLFAPLLYFDYSLTSWALIWQPLLVSASLFMAQILVFIALQGGDVSVQTPVMGTKALIVAILSFFLLDAVIPLSWWFAAGLAMLAVYLMSKTDNQPILRKKTLTTVILTLASAFFFALADVVMEMYAQGFGATSFLVISMLGAAIGSFALIPFFEGKLFAMPKSALKWQLLGNFIMAAEALAFYWAISFYGNATAVNIIYTSRGMWGILLIWGFGHWIGNTERSAGRKVMINRLAGTVLLFSAIILVLAF